MAKRADVELRIRSKGMATKEVAELNAELDKLVDTQREQADAATLATRSLRELNAQQRDLSKIASELSRRRSLVETLIGNQAELNTAKTRINQLRAELAELLSMKSKGTFLGDIDKAIKNVRGELAGAEKSFNRMAGVTDKLDTKLKEIGVDTSDLASSLNTITSSANRASAALADQTSDIARYGNAVEDAARDARKLAEAQRFVAEQASRQSARRADAASAFGGPGFDAYQRAREAKVLKAALAETGRETAVVTGITERFNAVLARNPKYQQAMRQQTVQVASGLTAQASATERARQSLDRYNKATAIFADTGRKSLSVYQRIRGEILSMAAAYVGLYQAVSVFSSAMQVQQQRQAINAQLLTANGNNARYAAQDQKFLREEAERLGLVYDDLAKKYANFAISAKAAGLGDSATKEAFSQAADIVVGMRLAAEDADGVFRAFVQIMSKSRVQAEELRGQLGDRLPRAVAAFAKANNLALSELDEYLKKGKGNVESFLNFLEEYAATVKGSVEAGSTTLFADINRLKTAYNDFLELVATSGTSAELQKAVQSLTNALKGEQGARFAAQLATAFTAVVKALQFVIENFETFLTLAKLFIALQVAKAVVGLGAAFLETAANTVKAVTALRTFYTTAVAARTATMGLSTAMRGLLALAGPVAIAIGAIIGVFWNLHSATKALDEQLETLDKTLAGISNAKTTVDLGIATEETNRQLEESVKRVEELQDRVKNWNSLSGAGAGAVWDSMTEGTFTRGELERQISFELAKQQSLRQGLEVAQRKQLRLAEQERAEDEARRKAEEEAARAAAAGVKGDVPKTPTEKQARAEENARANAARALQKEILDLDQAIFDAQIEGSVRTSEEIQKNYELTIRKVEAQIAEQRLGLDRLEQNARTANGGDLTAADAASLETARQRVELLNLELNRRAMIVSQTQDIEVAERSLNELIAERDAKLAAINTQVELGIKTEIDGRREAIALQQEYGSKIVENVDQLAALLQALPPDLFARLGGEKLLAELQAIKVEAQNVKTEFQLIGENLGGQFASGVAQAGAAFAAGVADFLQGANSLDEAFKNAATAFQSFLADFLVGIGQAILQAIILQAIMNAINGTKGGYASAAMGVLAGVDHSGGIVGAGGMTRWAPADAFANAKRFHDGGLPGLKSNEVPTILERGEEVLTADDPRHAMNGGASGAAGNTTIINTIDSPSVVEAGLPTKAGTRVLVNTIKANRQQILTALGL